MKSIMASEVKRGFITYCVLFTILTILSSTIQLLSGQLTDTNSHIIHRAAISFIGILSLILFEKCKFRNAILSYLVPYVITMAVVFTYVWLVSFFETLHPNAYRDIFYNFTAITVCISVVTFAKEKWIKHKQWKIKS